MVNLVLRAGALDLELAPAIGGSIARFDYVLNGHRQPLLRPAAPGADSPLAMASFPIVPFANRVRGGSFVCDDRTVTLTPNLPGDPSPLHGQGWLNPWQVMESDEHWALLHFIHEAGEWPWRYEAWQEFELDERGLSITLTCRNLSPERMPCALALHPYFPCDAATVIDVEVASVWTVDAQTLPVCEVDAIGRYDLRNRRICGTGLDNGFEGWVGKAEFCWPGGPVDLSMWSADATRFQIYSPPNEDYFAAEPVQNTNAAFNAPQDQWSALGILMLEEAAVRQLIVRFDVNQSRSM